MEQEISIDTKNVLQSTHHFVYKGKQYPFNMKLFKCFSQYFQTNKNLFKNTTDINLLDDPEDKTVLTENTIYDFINFCQKEKIKLTKENAPALHKLAKKYIVPPLTEATSKFISSHLKDVVVDLLVLNQDNDKFRTEEYEEMISQNFPNYVTDDHLLSLSIPILYRILSKSQQYSKTIETNDQYNKNITELLFKCLDHFGRPASVLFSCYQIQDPNHNFLTRLHDEYSTRFDFHFINEATVRSFYNKESNILEQTSKLKIELEKMKTKQEKAEKGKDKKIEEQKEEIRKLQIELEKMKTEQEKAEKGKDKKIEEMKEEIRKLKEEQTKMKTEQEKAEKGKDKKIEEQKEEIRKLQIELEKMKTEQEKAEKGKDKKIEEQKEKIRKLKIELEKMKAEQEKAEKGKDKKIEEQKEEIRKLQKEKEKMTTQIQQLKQDESEKIGKIQNDFSSQLESMMSQINYLKEKMKEITVKKEEKQKTTPSFSIRFSCSSNHKGLISNLGGCVTLSATGYPNPNRPVTNIKSYDDNVFYNYYDVIPQSLNSESDSIIKFDFGSSRRVDLYSYFIRSNGYGPSSRHPKTWRVEGSNDDLLWTRLDRRLNDENLRGSYKEHNFECQENRHLDEKSRFRYIRYVQEDSWKNNNPYCIWITYFELYGDVFNN